MAAVQPPGAAPGLPPAAELPIEGKTVKALTLLSLKRTYDLFVGNHGQKAAQDEESQRLKIACKVRRGAGAAGGGRRRQRACCPASDAGPVGCRSWRWRVVATAVCLLSLLASSPAHCCRPPQLRDEYEAVKGYKLRDAPGSANRGGPAGPSGGAAAAAAGGGKSGAAAAGVESKSALAKMIDSLPEPADK